MEVQQRNKYPNWAEEQRKKAAELARVRAIREKKMDRNKKEVREAHTSEAASRVALKKEGGSVTVQEQCVDLDVNIDCSLSVQE